MMTFEDIYMLNDSVIKALTSMGRGAPIMTAIEFAKLSGMTEDSVRKAIQRGYLPSFKVGRGRVFVNVAQLTLDALGVDVSTSVALHSAPPSPPRPTTVKKARKGRNR
jgi:hypothetical protein